MFNIFINGIVETLQDENSDPVLIGNTSINTLLYADDLVLLSSSPQGLQNCLEKLSVFCASWKLVVNISKSKALIFNSNGKSFSNHFYYNNSIIETVTQYRGGSRGWAHPARAPPKIGKKICFFGVKS